MRIAAWNKGGRQFFEKSLIRCDLQGIFTLSSQNLDAHPWNNADFHFLIYTSSVSGLELPNQREVSAYIENALESLEVADLNLKNNFPASSVNRAYYDTVASLSTKVRPKLAF